MLAHRITSQMLFGIKTSSGFSSNADELKTSYEIMLALVIQPFQEEIVTAIQGILEFNGIDGEALYFAPLIPFGFLSEYMDDAGAANAKEMIQNPNADMPDAVAAPADTTSDNPNEEIGNVVGPENTGEQGT